MEEEKKEWLSGICKYRAANATRQPGVGSLSLSLPIRVTLIR